LRWRVAEYCRMSCDRDTRADMALSRRPLHRLGALSACGNDCAAARPDSCACSQL
jgi:hypothetical protein